MPDLGDLHELRALLAEVDADAIGIGWPARVSIVTGQALQHGLDAGRDGVGAAAFQAVECALHALALDGLQQVVDRGRVEGLQWSGVNMAGSFEGAQLGIINYVESPSIGGRLGFANISLAEMVGADLGAVNYAARVEGVQIGFVNVTEHLHGVQIGLVNVAPNGFLPVFVLFNAAL